MERKLKRVNISNNVIKYPEYAALKIANGYTEILKGQDHQPHTFSWRIIKIHCA